MPIVDVLPDPTFVRRVLSVCTINSSRLLGMLRSTITLYFDMPVASVLQAACGDMLLVKPRKPV